MSIGKIPGARQDHMVFPICDLHLNSAKVIIYCMKRNTLALLIILIIAYGCQAVWNSTLAPGELLCENLKESPGNRHG